jgi:hypothetical protein
MATQFGEARFAGAGNLSARANMRFGPRITIPGAGSFSINVRERRQHIAATFAGTAIVSADPRFPGQAAGALPHLAAIGEFAIGQQTAAPFPLIFWRGQATASFASTTQFAALVESGRAKLSINVELKIRTL